VNPASGPADGRPADAQSADALSANASSAESIIAATRSWLEKAVIGLKLCPFAAGPYAANRVRYSVSEARTEADLLEALSRELQSLHAADPAECETTLLIHPWVLGDFRSYNDFLADGDDLLIELDLEGELQIASFHPAYRFAGTTTRDIENFTNRSPYPMLHLLREASVEKAVASFAGIDDVGANNIQTLRRLGHEGWRRLWVNDN
jgi:uncharacterized protein